ncbi:MAG: prepilin peptidase, partial [Dehalococcoidia bacterium]|nr:prepilin peptidase [Dehalococcoidia bacterium]
MPTASFLSTDTVFAIVAGIFGLAIGSFLNVVIHRLPRMMDAEWRAQCAELEGKKSPETGMYNLRTPRSHCPACKAQLRVVDNIPLVSYLRLRGKCSHCGAPISARYP